MFILPFALLSQHNIISVNFQCTAKMKKFIPGRCHSYHGDADTKQGALEEVVDMPEIPGFVDMEPMEQFIAQVDKCEDCTTGCLKGLANVHVSTLSDTKLFTSQFIWYFI